MQAIALHHQHIPMPATSLVGRERDLRRILELLMAPETRLVTLTGPGGVGKTRLALQIAHELDREVAGDVVLVLLAAVDAAEGVLPAIARGVGISQSEANPLEDRIIDAIGSRRMVLMLDNAEQVAEHLTPVSTLLTHCPKLKVLVTSRVMLRLSAERVVPVEPLPATSASASDLAPATALFVDRARAVRPDLELTDETVRAIDDICQQLDGLPLAIELAAARTRFLSPPALRDRLSERLPVLVGGPRDAPERHQTLRAALQWSHDLLSDDERLLFRRLAIFRGSAPYDAIEPVCNADGVLSDRTEELLGALADHSLVRIYDRPNTGPRVRLLNTIREFAREALEASGEAEMIADAHADWFAHLVNDLPEEHWRTGVPELRAWTVRHEPDLENLRVALERVATFPDLEPATRMVTGLVSYWLELGELPDAFEWTRRLLPHAETVSPEPRLRFAYIAATIARVGQPPEEALELAQQALALAEEVGHTRLLANLQSLIGLIHWDLEEPETAERWQMLAVETIQQTPEPVRGGMFLATTGEQLIDHGQVERGEALLREGIRLTLAERPDAAPLFQGSLAHLLLERGELDEAGELIEAGLAYHRDPPHRQPHALASRLCDTAVLASRRGRPADGVRLLGAARIMLERTGLGQHREVCEMLESATNEVVAALDDATLRRETAAGKAIPVPEAISLAIEITRMRREADPVPAMPDATPEPGDGLTERQRDVLQLLAEGRSNAEIAEALFISERTVTTHLTNIYDRLGVATRGQAIARANQLGIVPSDLPT